MSARPEPSISVAVACHNGLPYIQEQVASILHQTRPPNEIVFCDDLSSDGTLEWLQRLAIECAIPVRIHSNTTQLGPAQNFAKAASFCQGDIVAFCDQDDWWEPNKLEEVARFFERNNKCSVVVHNMHICSGNLDVQIENYFEYMHKNGYSLDCFTKGCAMAARREVLDIAFPMPAGAWMHDTRVLCVAHLLSAVAYIPSVLARYRVHGANHSGFIFPRRGKGGRILARLDALAFRRSKPVYRAWSMYRKRPIGGSVAKELLMLAQRCNELVRQKGDPSALVDGEALLRCVENLDDRYAVSQRPGLVARLYGYTYSLISGGYGETGGIFGYVADVGRALGNHTQSEVST